MSELLCGGHCCRKFYTRYSPAEWERYAKASREGKRYFRLDSGNTHQVSSNDRDVMYIAAMLISLPREGKGGSFSKDRLRSQFPYTCKHYNPETTLCSAYADRPTMCSNYPEYGDPERKCSYEACQCNKTPAEAEEPAQCKQSS